MSNMYNLMVVLLVISVILLLLVILFFTYHQVFKKIDIKEIDFPDLYFAYQFHKGDYKDNMSILERLLEVIQNYPIKISRPMIIYYDNSNKISKKELKSEIGFIVDGMGEIKKQLPFQIKKIEYSKCLYARFPYKSRFSIIIGASKVFHALKKQISKMSLTEREIMEIYNISNKEILYYMPLK